MLTKLTASLLGGRSDFRKPLAVSPPEIKEDERFQAYTTFALKDGHLLVSELEKLEVDFEIEIDDGISSGNESFGSSGDRATMTIYIEEKYRDVLDDLVKIHFHAKG